MVGKCAADTFVLGVWSQSGQSSVLRSFCKGLGVGGLRLGSPYQCPVTRRFSPFDPGSMGAITWGTD